MKGQYMDLEHRLINTREKLARVKEQREIDLQKYRQELAQREQQKERSSSLESFRSFVVNYEASSAQHIEALEAEIADLEALVTTDEYQIRKLARMNLEAMKETARAAWSTAGGLDEDFDGAWPTIKREFLIQQVLKVITVSTETVH
jgi:predicted nuclease with TOPRIM domain